MNFLQVIEKFVESGLSKVETPVTDAEKAVAVFEAGIQEYPEVKAATLGFIGQCAKLAPLVTAEVGADGLNLAGYLPIFAQGQAVFSYFTDTLLPAYRTAYEGLKAAGGSSAPASSSSAASSAAEKSVADLAPVKTEVAPGQLGFQTVVDQAGNTQPAGEEVKATPGPGLHTVLKK